MGYCGKLRFRVRNLAVHHVLDVESGKISLSQNQVRSMAALLLKNIFLCFHCGRNSRIAERGKSRSIVDLEKQKPAAKSDGLKFKSKFLDLGQADAAFGAAACDDRAASGRGHPGAKT